MGGKKKEEWGMGGGGGLEREGKVDVIESVWRRLTESSEGGRCKAVREAIVCVCVCVCVSVCGVGEG